jgi:hypothetical protein
VTLLPTRDFQGVVGDSPVCRAVVLLIRRFRSSESITALRDPFGRGHRGGGQAINAHFLLVITPKLMAFDGLIHLMVHVTNDAPIGLIIEARLP